MTMPPNLDKIERLAEQHKGEKPAVTPGTR